MTNILEHYKVLGVDVGAGIADVTSSYRRLCRAYHPDINDDPESEELMKRINVAYAVLRERLAWDAALRERQQYARSVRRNPYTDTRARGTDTRGTETRYSQPRAESTQSRTGNATQPRTESAQPRAGSASQTQPRTESAQPRAGSASQTQPRAESASQTQPRADSTAEEREAYSVLYSYFKLISACDYSGAYNFLSNYDKRNITRESFIQWRKSVARLYPIRAFTITGGLPAVTVSFSDRSYSDRSYSDRSYNDRSYSDRRSSRARRFIVAVTEENFTEGPVQQESLEKLVIFERAPTERAPTERATTERTSTERATTERTSTERDPGEHGAWKVFLGYKGVGDLTRSFEEKYEVKRRNEVTKRWAEYSTGQHREYDMLSLAGLRKAASREIYRQKRFGGALSFAAISIKSSGTDGSGQEDLLRSAARTINGALRETDVPAYAGDGIFAILFVELRKKNLDEIVGRLIGNIRKNAGQQLGGLADIEYAVESWSGGSNVDMDGLNGVLKKFHKKV